MKPTYKNIAKHFNIKAYQTVSKMKVKNRKMYDTLREKFMKDKEAELQGHETKRKNV